MTVAEIRLAQRDHAGARGAADDAAGWYRKQGRDGWMAISIEPRPAGRGTATSSPHRRRRPARRGRRPTRSRWTCRRSVSVTAWPPRWFVPNRATWRSKIPSPPTPAGEFATDRRRTASSSPMSTPSPPIGAAIVRRRVGRSAVGSPRRWRAKPPSVRSRHVLMRRCTATPSTEIGARIAIADRRPRELLARIEATSVMAARTPTLRPPTDPELARLLAELRGHEMTLADASVAGAGAPGVPSATTSASNVRSVVGHVLPVGTHRPGSTSTGRSSRRSGCSAIVSCSLTPASTVAYTPFRWSPVGLDCTTSGRSTTSTSGSRR